MFVPATAPTAGLMTAMIMIVSMMMIVIVVVAVRAVHMPVFNLIGPRQPHIQNLNIEYQVLPGERMVGVEENFIALNRRHSDDGRMAVAVGLEHVANVDLLDRQFAPRHPADQLVVAGAIGLLRRNHDHALGARGQAAQRLLESVDDLAAAL